MFRRPRLEYEWRGRVYRVWYSTPRGWRLIGFILSAAGVLDLLLAIAGGGSPDDFAAAVFGVVLLIVGVALAWLAQRRVRYWDERERSTLPGVRRL